MASALTGHSDSPSFSFGPALCSQQACVTTLSWNVNPPTCGRGRKQPSAGGPSGLAVAVAVAAVRVGQPLVVVSVQRGLVSVGSASQHHTIS